MCVVNDNIAIFTNSPVRWVDNWFNTPVKKISFPADQLLNLPEFVVSFFNNLPIEHFDKFLKLNRDWYKECKRELANRRKSCIKKYWDTIEKYKKANKVYNNRWESEITNDQFLQCLSEYNRLYEKKHKDFKAWVEVDKACLRCGFPELIDHKDSKYYIEMFNWDIDPYEIPSQEETDAWNRGRIDDFSESKSEFESESEDE